MGRAGLGGGIGVMGGVVALLGGAPWFVVLPVVAVVAVLVGPQIVIPQDSKHKLDWWKDGRDRKERRQERRDERREKRRRVQEEQPAPLPSPVPPPLDGALRPAGQRGRR
ncbi:hypothetical protein ACFCX4_05315 [Kitasatospora sp. NPDC056327]|uniref:hypothetical protein n=1 Tax=Kitasatospora sp. NPDC056327 TaxID=3345785 RepID=UPI0035D803CF